MAAKKDDVGQAEVQATVDEQNEKGYLGSKPDIYPNSAFSLGSGPESPSAAEQTAAARAEAAEQSRKSAVKGGA